MEENGGPKGHRFVLEPGGAQPTNISKPNPSIMTMASLPPPPPQPRGVDYSIPTCRETQCNGRGTCRVPMGGGGSLVCDCMLGYKGEWCEDTVNESLSVSLTLGVLAFIVGIVLLAFLFAKIRQRQKKKKR
ncbi:hypothetical protein NHX12_027692 [Muraenolepis orangiensis]|uniref:EGF-like domain-containing protein n=1 Tax=Muraenolepis orangiensis TaxID=630683 RepID=A0A9Q0ECR3_9TELE|nr:hypothetical protein NHX12_027692 [Muraenolepis orangiensis]